MHDSMMVLKLPFDFLEFQKKSEKTSNWWSIGSENMFFYLKIRVQWVEYVLLKTKQNLPADVVNKFCKLPVVQKQTYFVTNTVTRNGGGVYCW